MSNSRTPFARHLLIVASAWLLPAAAHAASIPCAHPGSPMEKMICRDPRIGARDEALARLYAATLQAPGAMASRERQRAWLAQAKGCGSVSCLMTRYDDRISQLLQDRATRSVGRRFILRAPGSDGHLALLIVNGWLVYDVVNTVAGPQGEAAGDIQAVSMTGAAPLRGSLAHEVKTGGCEVLLQHNANDSWSLEARHCEAGQQAADVGGLYVPSAGG